MLPYLLLALGERVRGIKGTKYTWKAALLLLGSYGVVLLVNAVKKEEQGLKYFADSIGYRFALLQRVQYVCNKNEKSGCRVSAGRNSEAAL